MDAHGCSRGSAFPATLAFQIRELEKETEGDLKLDAIITVIDAENFSGYEDTSPTARMQASYTDMLIIVSGFLSVACEMTVSNGPLEQMGANIGAEARPPFRPRQHIKRHDPQDPRGGPRGRRPRAHLRPGLEAVPRKREVH